jgi:hypothetical protein
MPLKPWNGSAFLTAKTLSVWNGSAWVSAKSAKVWNGSSWVNFLSSVNITDQGGAASGSGFDSASAQSGYRLKTNGSAEIFEYYGGDGGLTYIDTPISGQWFVDGNASDFSVRGTQLSYNASASSSIEGNFGTWQALTTERAWSIFDSATGASIYRAADASILIEIAYTADTSTVIDSATISFSTLIQTA